MRPSGLLAQLSLDQELPLLVGHLFGQSLEQLGFFDPSFHLLAVLCGDVQCSGRASFFPRQQRGLMNGTLAGAPALWIAATFPGNRQASLYEGLDAADARQNSFSIIACCFVSSHMESINTFHTVVKGKVHQREKIFLRIGLRLV